jgi:hypothetical protein
VWVFGGEGEKWEENGMDGWDRSDLKDVGFGVLLETICPSVRKMLGENGLLLWSFLYTMWTV